MACSIYTIGGATEDDVSGNPDHYLVRQAVYAVVGLVIMLGVGMVDYSRLRALSRWIYGGMLVSIAAVMVLATATRGSRRWIETPFFNLQPSELGKVLLVVALSAFVVDRVRRLDERETTSRIVLLALLPAMLVIAQPDLGTGLVYLVICGGLLFVAGTRWTHFAALGTLAVAAAALVLVAAPAAGLEVLKPYQLARLTSFVNPTEDTQEQGYQLSQSMTAIGAGQRTGRGPDQATQTKLDFLPEHHTDFVFSVVGESFGFVGTGLVLALYTLLVWRGLRIMTMAKNLFGALIAGGIVSMLIFQVFVNIGMTIGIMPITGVPLPLMSYGGSSVLVTFLALGLLESIHVQAREIAAAKGRDRFA